MNEGLGELRVSQTLFYKGGNMAFYTIYPRDIQNICFQKRVRVVDIREPQEYRKYHYPGAVNIPYSDEDSWCCRFSKYRPLLLYCEYGSTSLLAARKLGKEGYEVYTVIGGANAMQEQIGR